MAQASGDKTSFSAWNRAPGSWSMNSVDVVVNSKDKDTWPAVASAMKDKQQIGGRSDGTSDPLGSLELTYNGGNIADSASLHNQQLDAGGGVWAGGGESAGGGGTGASHSWGDAEDPSCSGSGNGAAAGGSHSDRQWAAPSNEAGPTSSSAWGAVDRSPSLPGWGELAPASSASSTTGVGTVEMAHSGVGGTTSWGKMDSGDADPVDSANWGANHQPLPGSKPLTATSSLQNLTIDDVERKELEAQYQVLINSNEGWGRRPVNQSTPWDTDMISVPSTSSAGVGGAGLKPGAGGGTKFPAVESNVWPSEPPTGTGIWEALYESLGERTAHWQQSAGAASLPTSANTRWEGVADTGGYWPNEKPPRRLQRGGSGSQWDGSEAGDVGTAAGEGSGEWWGGGAPPARSQDAMGWIGGPAAPPGPPLPPPGSQRWNEHMQQPPPSMQAGRGDDGGSMWSMGGPGASSSVGGGSKPSSTWGGEYSNGAGWNGGVDLPSHKKPVPSSSWGMHGDEGRRGVMPPPGVMGNINRSKADNLMRIHQVKYLMNMGYKKEDAQTALINNNMNSDRAMQELRERHGPGMAQGGQPGSSDMLDMDEGVRLGMQQNPSSQNMMRQQIMQQMHYAFNNRMQGSPGGASSGPHPPTSAPSQLNNHTGAGGSNLNNNAASGTNNPMQQRELQVLHSIMVLHQKHQSTQTKLNQLRSNQSALPPHQIHPIVNEMQMQLQYLTQQITAQQNQLKLVRSHLVPQQQQQFQPQDILANQMSDMKLQQRGPLSNSAAWKSNDMLDMLPGAAAGGHHLPQQQAPQHAQSAASQQQQMFGGGGGGGNLWPESSVQQHHQLQMQEMAGSAAGGGNNPSSGIMASGGLNPMVGVGAGGASSSSASVDIPEFVPGQPWHGMSSRDDLTVTPGSARGLLTVQNDHLERLTNVDAISKSAVGQHQQHPGKQQQWQQHSGAGAGLNGVVSGNGAGSGWLIIRNLFAHITVDMLRSAFANQPGVQMHPNMYSGWVLLRFHSAEESVKALRQLAGRVGTVEPISGAEASSKLQEIQNLATRFNVAGQNSAMGWHGGDPSIPSDLHNMSQVNPM